MRLAVMAVAWPGVSRPRRVSVAAVFNQVELPLAMRFPQMPP